MNGSSIIIVHKADDSTAYACDKGVGVRFHKTEGVGGGILTPGQGQEKEPIYEKLIRSVPKSNLIWMNVSQPCNYNNWSLSRVYLRPQVAEIDKSFIQNLLIC